MIDQIAIAVTGVTAIFLTQQANVSLKKYAPLFGLAGQPFWWYATFTSEQYGIFVLTMVYTYLWALGIYNQWIKPKRKETRCE